MSRVDHLTKGSVSHAPAPCRSCMWWQSGAGVRPPDRESWMVEAEDEFGPWGKLYVDDDGRTIGLIQYGPADRFPRARALPAGPPAADAALITCAYLVDVHSPWVLQSLFLAASGECKVRGFPSLEAFAYRYQPEETFAARFLGHRTIFPADFLRDFGFQGRRTAGRIELVRLDLRGTVPVEEATLTERIKARLAVIQPAPAAP